MSDSPPNAVPPPHPKHLSGKLVAMILIVVPVVALAWLMYAVDASIESGTKLAAPAKGAGAGDTGGANAIGVYLSHPNTSGE